MSSGSPDLPIRTRVHVRKDRLPRPGTHAHAWAWEDVLEAAPPGGRAVREAAFVIRHGFDEVHPDPEARVGYATIVIAERGKETLGLVVDELVAVEPRLLGNVLLVERAVSRRMEAGSQAGLKFMTRGSDALSQRVGGRPGEALQRGTARTVRAVSWTSGILQNTVRAVIEAPDRLFVGARSADAHLARARDRRALLRGLADPYNLTREGKTAALFLVIATLGLAALVGSLVVVFGNPDFAAGWAALVGYFFWGIVGAVLLPLFPEVQLFGVAAVVGPVVAILTICVASTVGGWLVLFAGDEIHGVLKKRAGTRPRLARALETMEAFARRYGFLTAFGVISIPMGPMTPLFYALATVRTPLLPYLLGTFLGCLVRFTVWYYAVSAF